MSLMNTIKKSVKPAITRAVAIVLVLGFVVNVYAQPMLPQYIAIMPTTNLVASGVAIALTLLIIGIVELKVPAVRKILN